MSTASRHVLSALMGLVCAFCAARAFSPERHLPSKKLVLLFADSCPKSLALRRQVMESPELSSHILTLSIDPINPEDDAPDCGRADEDVLQQAPWLHIVDRAWLCRRLVQHAAMLHQKHFVALPAWLDGGAPLPHSQEHAALERHGLGLCPGPILHVGEASCAEAGAARVPGVMMVGTVERGADIGF